MKFRRIAPIFFAALLIFISSRSAWADSCPYCSQSYGDAAPGDESRVYALRTEHEASCPSRPSGSSGGSGDATSTQRWTRQDQLEYEQMQLAEQERQRQIAEEKRKEHIKHEAEERAENEARKLEWEKKKGELSAMLKGASPSMTDGGLKSAGRPDIFLTPRGIKSKSELIGDEKGNAVRTQILQPGKVSDASDLQTKNLRRAMWLYHKAAQAPSSQEAEFLIQQADEAAQGHDLKVEVPAGPEVSQITPEKIAKFKEIKKEIETQRIQTEILSRKKLGLEDKRNLYKRGVEDLEGRLKELRDKKETNKAEPEKTEEAKHVEALKEDKPADPEEDLLAQLMAATKEMADVDKALDQLTAEEAEIKTKISDQEKRLGAVLN